MSAIPIVLGPSKFGHSQQAIIAYGRALREPTSENKAAWERERLRIRQMGTAIESGTYALGATILVGVVWVVRRPSKKTDPIPN
jgi:hypothetical protein